MWVSQNYKSGFTKTLLVPLCMLDESKAASKFPPFEPFDGACHDKSAKWEVCRRPANCMIDDNGRTNRRERAIGDYLNSLFFTLSFTTLKKFRICTAVNLHENVIKIQNLLFNLLIVYRQI